MTTRRGFIATLAAALGLLAFIKPKSNFGLLTAERVGDWCPVIWKRTIGVNPNASEAGIQSQKDLILQIERAFFFGNEQS